jgi:hypothetical protein
MSVVHQINIISKTLKATHDFELGQLVKLCHHVEDIEVVIAIIISAMGRGRLHNMLQSLDYYKVFVVEAIVDVAPLMIPNMDDYPPLYTML